MTEYSEGGLRGFLRKLGFGQARKEPHRQTTRSIPSQPQPSPEQLEQERARARERYENTKLRLQRQLTLGFPDIPDGQIDYRKELIDLEARVKAIEIYGKFYGGLRVKDRLFTETDSSDFSIYGDTQAIPKDVSVENQFSPLFIIKCVLREIPKQRDPEIVRDLRKKHFLTYQTSETGETLVSYIF